MTLALTLTMINWGWERVEWGSQPWTESTQSKQRSSFTIHVKDRSLSFSLSFPFSLSPSPSSSLETYTVFKQEKMLPQLPQAATLKKISWRTKRMAERNGNKLGSWVASLSYWIHSSYETVWAYCARLPISVFYKPVRKPVSVACIRIHLNWYNCSSCCMKTGVRRSKRGIKLRTLWA